MGLTFNLGRVSPSVFTDSSLNVGIGAAPSGTYKFEVTGTAKVSSTLLVSGVSTFSGRVNGVEMGVSLNGSDSVAAGPFFRYTNAAIDRQMLTQLNASNGLTTWAFNGTSWASIYTLTSGGKVTIPSGAYGTSYYTMNYTSANAGSREWAIGSDTAGWGSFSIGQATTQGGSTFSDKIIISSAGNVGIGINSTSAKLYVLGSNEVFNVAGTNAVSTYTGYYYNTSTLVGYIGNGSSILSGAASDSFIFRSEGALVYAIGNSERMRITGGGLFKFQNNGSSYESGTAGVNEFNTAANDTNVVFRNTASSLTAARAGIDVFYSAAAPNSTTACFYQAADNAAGRTLRFSVRSNGGIENYTANNIPLSDERLKKDIIPLESVWDKIKNIEIVKYKFKDQTHEDFNMGVIAQQVQKVAPELVDDEGWGTFAEDGTTYKGIWETDLNYYSIKALQEAMTKIEEQQATITSLQDRLDKAGL